MIYNLHNLRTIYKDKDCKPIFSTKKNIRVELQIDFHIDYLIVENIFKKYKVYNSFGTNDTIYDIKIMHTLINIYKHKNEL